ncbi:MAG: hypothetical protein ACRDTH_26930, partial [Pseudonocardiaceae bacterium]
MGWNNPPLRWLDLERALSGLLTGSSLGHRDEEHPGDGGDSPAWTRHRHRYQPLRLTPAQSAAAQPHIPYAELHCHSNFSFLDGASHPEELVEEAARLG